MGAQLVHVAAPKKVSLQQRNMHKHLHRQIVITQLTIRMLPACALSSNQVENRFHLIATKSSDRIILTLTRTFTSTNTVAVTLAPTFRLTLTVDP